jgi:diguanylate cyclase (GGDEF)-like protein
LSKITHSVNAGIAYIGADLCYKFVNQTYIDQFNLDEHVLLNCPMNSSMPEETYAQIKPAIDRVLDGYSQNLELEIIQPSHHICFNVHLTPDFCSDRQVLGCYLVCVDITERKKLEYSLTLANYRLKQLADLDGLTKVSNRRKFDEYLNQQWQIHKEHNEPLSLILFDVDYFKRYNDCYGHQLGDDCLIKIAQAVRKKIEPGLGLLARYGGEEFAIVLPHTTCIKAQNIAQEIQGVVAALAIPHEESSVKSIVSISLGIATFIPTITHLPSDLIAQADQALYRAKQQGRDCYQMAKDVNARGDR